ncbi:MAG: GtrA family protein [Bacteroidales bacterium]|nr:GtrA family protein [Bacteroidales bacterium]MCF8404224.1 GtrA family protein [Bacteroidales bacterium]
MKDNFRIVRNRILILVGWAYIPFRKVIPPETFRYAFTGGINTAFDILLYFVYYNYILHQEILELGFVAISPHIAAFLLVFPITFTSGFILARYITFTSSPLRGKVQLFRYAMSVGGSILLNYILLKILVEELLLWPTIAKIITTVVVVMYSYLAQRYYTFKTGKISQ